MSTKRKKRSFALMCKKKLHAATSAGGTTAHRLGKAHTWSAAEAQKAGERGGKVLKGSKWSRYT